MVAIEARNLNDGEGGRDSDAEQLLVAGALQEHPHLLLDQQNRLKGHSMSKL